MLGRLFDGDADDKARLARGEGYTQFILLSAANLHVNDDHPYPGTIQNVRRPRESMNCKMEI